MASVYLYKKEKDSVCLLACSLCVGKRGEEEAKTALLPPSLFLRDEANLGLPLARDGQKGGEKKVFGVRPVLALHGCLLVETR